MGAFVPINRMIHMPGFALIREIRSEGTAEFH